MTAQSESVFPCPNAVCQFLPGHPSPLSTGSPDGSLDAQLAMPSISAVAELPLPVSSVSKPTKIIPPEIPLFRGGKEVIKPWMHAILDISQKTVY